MRRPEIVFGRQSEKKMCRGQALKTGLTLAVTIFLVRFLKYFRCIVFNREYNLNI